MYTWNTDNYEYEGSFHAISPSGTEIIIASGSLNGSYTIFSETFNGEFAKGFWRFWIEDSYGDGGHQATNIFLNITIMSGSYIVVTIPESAIEGENLTGIVTAIPSPETDMIVNLSSSNPSQISMPSTTIISLGNNTALFNLSFIDDIFLCGTLTTTIVASALNYSSGSNTLRVDENENAILKIVVPEIATKEYDKKLQGQITVSKPVDCDYEISLVSSDNSIITVPKTATIFSEMTVVNFTLIINNDDDESVNSSSTNITITASVGRNLSASDTINLISVKLFKIYSFAGEHGSIFPSGEISVGLEQDRVFAIIPDYNYEIDEIDIDGIPYSSLGYGVFPFFSFFNNLESHTISVTFKPQFYSNNNDLQSMIPDRERQALIDLYNSTNGDNWKNNNAWLGDPGTECSWYGISCNDTNSHVTRIELGDNGLQGNIPASFNNFTKILEVYLHSNQLTSLPSELDNLTSLWFLSIYSNQLTSLPSEIGSLNQLQFIILSNNKLSSLPESFANLIQLHTLYLDSNQLTIWGRERQKGV